MKDQCYKCGEKADVALWEGEIGYKHFIITVPVEKRAGSDKLFCEACVQDIMLINKVKGVEPTLISLGNWMEREVKIGYRSIMVKRTEEKVRGEEKNG
jgi:hypothetical protein